MWDSIRVGFPNDYTTKTAGGLQSREVVTGSIGKLHSPARLPKPPLTIFYVPVAHLLVLVTPPMSGL